MANLKTDAISAAMGTPALRPQALTLLQEFLATGGSPGTKITSRARPARLLTASVSAAWEDAVRILLAAGADVHANGDEALWTAIGRGNPTIVERLLAAGANVHARNGKPLAYAAWLGRQLIVERLLAAGADVHAGRDLALWWAAAAGRQETVALLLASGADVHACNEETLLQAIHHGHNATALALIAAGASVHAHNGKALRSALEHAQTDIVHALLCRGADAVAAWNQMSEKGKRMASGVLDNLADAIPFQQRSALVQASPRRFPALRAMLAAEHRRPPDRRAAEHRQGTTP